MKTIEDFLKDHKFNGFGVLSLAALCQECGYSYDIVQKAHPIYEYTWYIMRNKRPLRAYIAKNMYIMLDITVKNAMKSSHDNIVSYKDPYLKFVRALHDIYGLDLGTLATEFVRYGYPDIAILILRLNDISVNNVDRFDI